MPDMQQMSEPDHGGRRTPIWTLGDKLTKSRKAARLKQLDIARVLRVGRSTIVGWERDIHAPAYSQIKDWAEITSVPVMWLLDDWDDDGGPGLEVPPTACYSDRAGRVIELRPVEAPLAA
jgi:transcriptional regulator with XRE-family HTH domain